MASDVYSDRFFFYFFTNTHLAESLALLVSSVLRETGITEHGHHNSYEDRTGNVSLLCVHKCLFIYEEMANVRLFHC